MTQWFLRARATRIVAGIALLSVATAAACVRPDEQQESRPASDELAAKPVRQGSLPDFRELDAGPERKEAFFKVLKPLVRAANVSIRKDRARLEKIAGKKKPNWIDKRWLLATAEAYGLELLAEDGDAREESEFIRPLLSRVDVIPMSLTLAQAAKESGWGTSRFAREGNNFFGEWCFSSGCGIVPASRADDMTHEVRAFDSPAASIASYMRNINTHDSYLEFREARQKRRDAGQTLTGISLVETLANYSERREEYVEEIKELITQNDLEMDDLDGASGS